MSSYLFDVLFACVAIVTAWALSRRDLLESLTAWIAALFSALIALNCFEPAADFVVKHMFALNDLWITRFIWFAAAISIFGWLGLLMWIGFQRVLGDAELHIGKFDSVGRWTASTLCGYTLAAFLLTSLHAFPADRDFGGAFPPELHRRASPIMAIGPDYQLLTVAEYISNPRSAFTGAPWMPRGPIFTTDFGGDRWSSFPVRYALWREAMVNLMSEKDVDSDEQYLIDKFASDESTGSVF